VNLSAEIGIVFVEPTVGSLEETLGESTVEDSAARRIPPRSILSTQMTPVYLGRLRGVIMWRNRRTALFGRS
jgi:hypothetical protein